MNMKTILYFLALCSFSLICIADNIPTIRWTVRSENPSPFDFSVVRGESKYMAITFNNYGTGQILSNVSSVVFRYSPTNVPAGTWYHSFPGVVSNAAAGQVWFKWTPAQESTNALYRYEVAVTSSNGTSLSARGLLTLENGIGQGIASNVAPITWASTGACGTNVTASTVSYSNPSHPSLTNVALALDQLLYVPPVSPAVSLSGGTAKYKGQTVVNPVVSWSVNDAMTYRELSGLSSESLGAGGNGSYTNEIVLDMNSPVKYVTIAVSNANGSASDTTSWSWTNLRYVGKSAGTSYLNAELLAMTASAQAKGSSGTASGLANEHIVIVYPASYGYCTVFSAGGFPTSSNSWPVASQSVTNAYGYAESYLVYRSLNVLTGSTTYDIH